MTDDATPKKIKRRRPTRYPASIAIMTTATQRAAIDAIADKEGRSVADVARGLIDDGLMCIELDEIDRTEIDRVARYDGTDRPTVLRQFVGYAIKKIDRVRRGIDRPAEITIDMP